MKTVLVTGGASGIGRATARRFAAADWRVYATDVDADGLADLDGCRLTRLDVTDRTSVGAVADRIEREAGGLDCVVAAAGYGQLGPLEDLPVGRLRRQFDVNVHGTLRTVQATLPLLRGADGTVVVLSSSHGRLTTPGWGAYAASKHAVEGLCDTLRMEVADQGVDVVLLEPAWVDTGFAGASDDSLTGFDRSSRYADVYDALDDGLLVDGGPLAVSPEAVARRVETIATTESPRARYTVGWPGRLVLATRWLPQPIQDWTQRVTVRATAALARLRGRGRR